MASDPILVVENGRLYTEQLITHGHPVVVAHDGDGAIGLLRSSRPRLMLLDMTAPQLDAVELCRHSRKIFGPGVPIIVLASPDDPDGLYDVLQNGADDYMLKLERAETIIERINYWLQTSAKPTEAPPPAPAAHENPAVGEDDEADPAPDADLPMPEPRPGGPASLGDTPRRAARRPHRGLDSSRPASGHVRPSRRHWPSPDGRR